MIIFNLLHCHVSQAAETSDSELLAGLETICLHGREDGDARTKQGSSGSKVKVVWDATNETFVDYDVPAWS